MRALLGGRVLNGSLQENASEYLLLISSSTGQIWTERIPKNPEEPSDLASAIPLLARRMAFRILSEDSSFAPLGITNSWEAFDAFQNGMNAWRTFNDLQDYSALSSAIQLFQEAIRKDPSFALARLQLGLALQRDAQNAEALRALRASVKSSPQSIPGRIALALASSSESPSRRLALVDAEPGFAPFLIQSAAQFSLLEQAQLYHGLCLQTLSAAHVHLEQKPENLEASESRRVARQASREHREMLAQAYFYCTQAERAYRRIPPSQRTDTEVGTNHAAALNQLGIILVSYQKTTAPLPTSTLEPGEEASSTDWSCAPEDIYGFDIHEDPERPNPIRLSRWNPRLQMASRYQAQAAALTDDPEIRCDAAMLSWQLGHESRMKLLRQDADMHVKLAESHRQNAMEAKETLLDDGLPEEERTEALAKADGHYRKALASFRSATELDSLRMDALTGFAHTFWHWKAFSLRYGSKGPDERVLEDAESVTRELQRMLLHNGSSKLHQIQAHHALGVLFLARNDLAEGERELHEAEELMEMSRRFDTIRRDHAFALECASHRAGRKSGSGLSEAVTSRLSVPEKGPALAQDTRKVCDALSQGAQKG